MKTYALRALVVLALIVLLAGVPGAQAQTGGGYDLTWWTVDGGGGAVSGGGYSLAGTAGQPDAGPVLSGGTYTLLGGFWPAGATIGFNIYMPLVMRNG